MDFSTNIEDHEHDFQWPEDENFYDDLFKCAPNLEGREINGGDPTGRKAHGEC